MGVRKYLTIHHGSGCRALADFCVLLGEDRMIMPWHNFKTGRMEVLNHCFIEGKNGSLHQRIQKTQEVKCSQLLPGGMGGARSVPGSRPSLFQVYLIENFTLKRVLHGTFGSCQMLPPGRRLTAPWTSREKPSKSEAPCSRSVGLQVAT